MQGGRVIDCFVVHFRDNVAWLNARFSCGTVGHQAININPLCQVEVFFFGKITINSTNHNAQDTSLNCAVLYQILDDLLHDIRRNSKAIAAIRSRRTCNRCIDANQSAIQIDQGSATVTWIDSCIGLDEVFDSILLFENINIAAFRTDDSCGYSWGQTKRITNRHDPFSDFHLIRIDERNDHQILGFNANQSQIRRRVGADYGRLEGAIVMQGHLDIVCLCDDMIVGNNVAFVVYHNPRTRADSRRRPLRVVRVFKLKLRPKELLKLISEEVPKWICGRRILIAVADLCRFDMHNAINHLVGSSREVQRHDFAVFVHGIDRTFWRWTVDVLDLNSIGIFAEIAKGGDA